MDTAGLKKTFGERLRRARLMRGLSLREVAAALAERGKVLSHAALQKYEQGLMGPDSTVLIALGELFGLESGYFFRQDALRLESVDFRKRTAFTVKEENRVREEALDAFERYLEIEAILEVEPRALPRYNLGEATDMAALSAEVEKAANSLRRTWKLGEDALPNVTEMLEEHGVKVKEVTATEAFDGCSGWANEELPVVVLADWLNADLPRKRFTALHELGHLVLKFPPDLPTKVIESLCHWFAGAMLLPASAMKARLGAKRSDGISFAELKAMKEDWGVSLAALMYRASNLGIITPSRLKSFQFMHRTKGWHKKEPGVWCGTERANRFTQLVHRAAAQELITRAKAAELLGMTHREFDHSFAAT
jgi:Zn-dependent peptidase ImmA (M78 family)